MNVGEAEQTVSEIVALLTSQQNHVQKLEVANEDTVSARIVLDSLRASLALAIQGWHLARCAAVSKQKEIFNFANKNRFAIVSNVATTGKSTSMAINRLVSIDTPSDGKQNEERQPAEVVTSGHTADAARDFDFRPLTEKEKKEFVDSLGEEGKRMLAELEGKSPDSDKFAAA